MIQRLLNSNSLTFLLAKASLTFFKKMNIFLFIKKSTQANIKESFCC
jgi:hypothetical protein